MLNTLKEYIKVDVALYPISMMELALHRQGVLFVDNEVHKVYPGHLAVHREHARLHAAIRELAQEAVRQYRDTHKSCYDQQHYERNVNLYEGSRWFNSPVAFTALGYNW